MSATLVPTVRTKYTLNELVGGLIEGWKKQFGAIPSKQSIGVLYAQNALETGGTVSMWNNNVGNVKFVPSANTDNDNDKFYMMLANVWEMSGGVKTIYQPPHRATWFRAFPTLAEGVAFHLDFLKNHRYKKAWSAVESGNPSDFAKLLRDAGYYTAPLADYTKLMNIYFTRFMKDTTYENVVAKLTEIPSIIIGDQLPPVSEIPQDVVEPPAIVPVPEFLPPTTPVNELMPAPEQINDPMAGQINTSGPGSFTAVFKSAFGLMTKIFGKQS